MHKPIIITLILALLISGLWFSTRREEGRLTIYNATEAELRSLQTPAPTSEPPTYWGQDSQTVVVSRELAPSRFVEATYTPVSDPTPEIENVQPLPEIEDMQPVYVTYVLNTNSNLFHYPSCADVEKMKEKNRQDYTGTREEVIAMGYHSCGHCNP